MNYELKMVEIEINHHCNRACTYCPNSVAERKEKGEMSPELFRRLMDQLKKMDYKGSISYEFYNEPLLAKNLDLFVEITREFLPTNQIDLYTNGTLLDRKRFKKLYNLGVSRFIVTKHLGAEDLVFDEVFPILSSVEKAKVVYQDYKDLKLTNRGGMVDAGPKGPKNLIPCFIPGFLAVVTVTGNVLPCFEDFHEENIMGNILETSIGNIWRNERFNLFRRNLEKGFRHTQSPCDKCNRTQVAHS